MANKKNKVIINVAGSTSTMQKHSMPLSNMSPRKTNGSCRPIPSLTSTSIYAGPITTSKQTSSQGCNPIRRSTISQVPKILSRHGHSFKKEQPWKCSYEFQKKVPRVVLILSYHLESSSLVPLTAGLPRVQTAGKGPDFYS